MSTTDTKITIQRILQSFQNASLADSAASLLKALGYSSDKTLPLVPNNAATFLETFADGKRFNQQKACVDEWRSVDFLFQLTADEIRDANGQDATPFKTSGKYNGAHIESYIFLAIELTGERYTRTCLGDITREVNRLFAIPAMILFRHGSTLTLSVINRRLHKRDEGRDVLEQVTLIGDIRLGNPLRAQIELLYDLSLVRLYQVYHFENFIELHDAWLRTLDGNELNKRFSPVAVLPKDDSGAANHNAIPSSSPLREKASEKKSSLSIEQFEDEDILATIRKLFTEVGELERGDEAYKQVGYALGFKRVHDKTRDEVRRAMNAAVRRGIVVGERGVYRIDCRNITDYDKDDLQKHLLAAMRRVWLTRDEAIRATASYLGFRSVGSRIRETLGRAITLALRRNELEKDGEFVRRV